MVCWTGWGKKTCMQSWSTGKCWYCATWHNPKPLTRTLTDSVQEKVVMESPDELPYTLLIGSVVMVLMMSFIVTRVLTGTCMSIHHFEITAKLNWTHLRNFLVLQIFPQPQTPDQTPFDPSSYIINVQGILLESKSIAFIFK